VRRLAIIGSGNMGGWHASRWQALPVELAGFYDAEPARAAALAAQYGGQAFATLEAALDSSDLIDICTPPADHASAAIAAARAGKHVVCEKPIARHLADARAMIAACEAAGVRLFVAHVVRFFPEFARAKAVLDSGALGRLGVVRSVRGGAPPGHSNWFADVAQSGGVTLDVAIHDIDYMRWLCGEIVEVSAVVEKISSLEIDTDDIADLTVRFESGAIGSIHMNLFAWNMHSHFELMGEGGVLQWRRFENEVRLYDPKADRWEIYPTTLQLNDMYVEEARHFVACVRGEARPACDGWDGLRTMKVIEAARHSAAEHRWVKV